MIPSSDLALRLAAASLDRRAFLKKSGFLAAAATAFASAGSVLTSGGKAEAAPLPFSPGVELDIALLNFALNLEYLEAEFYNLAAFGQTLADRGIDVSGEGQTGGLVVRSNPKVPFQNPANQQFAEEIANDEAAHVMFVRQTIIDLGGTPVAEPGLNYTDSFNAIAQQSGVGQSFDPFASDANFFIGGLSLSDVGVTAYRGAAGLLTDKNVISGSAGILAVEAYHSSLLRLMAFELGATTQAQTQAISDLRDSLDTPKKDKDQGVVDANGHANIVPSDANGLAFARTARQVLNIVYGGLKAPKGLFFPQGVNGLINK